MIDTPVQAENLELKLREALERYEKSRVPAEPVISLITPLWNTHADWFVELALSILDQSFLQWQWCLVDDCSSNTEFEPLVNELLRLPNVLFIRLEQPHGISRASNEGLKRALGRFVCFVDHDDTLARHALKLCVESLEQGNAAVYTDSDKIDEAGEHFEPFHKPDWSPEFFRGVMYVGHLLAVLRKEALAIGGFDRAYDGVQDFDFFLRYSEFAGPIAHIPEVLYHWRAVRGSVAGDLHAKGDVGLLQQKAVNAQLHRLGFAASAERGKYPHRLQIIPFQRSTFPKVSLIIPTKDSADVLHNCLRSVFVKSTYKNLEVLCVDNDTTDLRALEEMRSAPVERIAFRGRFNFSKANNLAREFSVGEYLIFMNNDVEVITPDWIEQMLYYAEQNDVGAVGGLLLYPNRTVQHAGVVLGCRGTADHVLRGAPGNSDGYAGSLSCAREVSAVTAACLMLKRFVFDEVGGFNEHFFTAYQDVDLCMKIRSKGNRIIFTPRAQLFHHESASRGSYYDMIDRHLLLDFWEPSIKAGDPYYNRNFDIRTLDYSLAAVR